MTHTIFKTQEAYDKNHAKIKGLKKDYLSKKINESDVKETANQYNNLFFDPLKQGFSDINSAIRNELFGSLDELKNKFGAIGASIIQSLQNVVAKLLETALLAGIVSLITGGGSTGLSFVQAFSSLAGGSSAGSLITGGKSNRIANQMITGSSRVANRMKIEVVGKLRGQDIYFSGNGYEAIRNVARA